VTERTQRRWRGVAPDERQAERRVRLLDAAFDLVGTEGTSAATVRGVCARAGLNSRYFYESFPDADALLVAVFDRLAAQTLTVAMAADHSAGAGPRARLRASLGDVARFLTEDERRIRVLAVEGVESSALNRRRLETLQTVARLGQTVAASSIGVPPSDPAARIAAHFAAGGLAQLLSAWLQDEIQGSLDELLESSVELVMALYDTTAGRARAAPLD
jgi:AcrR family transcriptional regulator